MSYSNLCTVHLNLLLSPEISTSTIQSRDEHSFVYICIVIVWIFFDCRSLKFLTTAYVWPSLTMIFLPALWQYILKLYHVLLYVLLVCVLVCLLAFIIFVLVLWREEEKDNGAATSGSRSVEGTEGWRQHHVASQSSWLIHWARHQCCQTMTRLKDEGCHL